MPIYAFSGSLTRAAPNYGEANGRGITTFVFDAAAGQLEPVAEFPGIDDANWLVVDAPRRRLYAVCEVAGTDQSWVESFAIGADGTLTQLNRQPTGGQTGCHASLSPDGRFLLVANYNAEGALGSPDGAVALFPVGNQGWLESASASVRHDGRGPNASRQTRSHGHCVVISPDGRFAYVADLGIDKIVVYAIGAQGSLVRQSAVDFPVPPGLGPRHLVFQAEGRRLFMVSELIATVLSLDVDPRTGALSLVDSFAIETTSDAVVQPSGIVLTADGKNLFVELRQCDEIIGLAVDPITGKLSQSGRWPAGGATPRDFAFSPDGRFLLVANQDADRITVFPVAGDKLGEPVQQLAVGTPMAVAFAVFPSV